MKFRTVKLTEAARWRPDSAMRDADWGVAAIV
jgi:hypothetical protein